MRADGRGKPRRLTKGFDLFPAWSPDGGKIAFTRDWSKNIYIINADARGLRRLNLRRESLAISRGRLTVA